MNIDNQLLLGVVFIIAGVALALLAYAVVLNRRSHDDLEESWGAPEPDGADTAAQPPVPATATPGSSIPGFEEPTRLIREPEAVPEAEEPAPPASLPPEPATVLAQPPASPSTVALTREAGSGKLLIQLGDQKFKSMSELKASPAWEQIGGLFEELLSWMVIVPPSGAPAARTREMSAEQAKKAPAASSMVAQINEILEERLAKKDASLQGVHLAEGSDGTIRVFIGLQGYPMDEVPNPEVRELIREAVAEWESRA
jgi:hypothetical protein